MSEIAKTFAWKSSKFYYGDCSTSAVSLPIFRENLTILQTDFELFLKMKCSRFIKVDKFNQSINIILRNLDNE